MTANPKHSAASIVGTAHVVAALGLVTAFGHVSTRETASSYRITGPGDLSEADTQRTVVVELLEDQLPDGAPPEAWLHTAIYRARPDVGAIVRAQPPSTFAAASVADELRPLHGQGAWVSARVPVHPVPRLCRSAELATAAVETMGAETAMLLRANGAVCVADSPGIAAARMWLLSVVCDVWLRASAVGSPVELDATDIDVWRTAGEQLLPRLWRHLEGRSMDFASGVGR